MTAAELYEIVTGHQDVWGKHFGIVKRSDGYVGFYRSFSNDELDPEHVENELLGLGVKWLVKNSDVLMHEHLHGGYVVLPRFEPGYDDKQPVMGPSVLAAVYAAIAYVKENTKGKE